MLHKPADNMVNLKNSIHILNFSSQIRNYKVKLKKNLKIVFYFMLF